MKITKYIIGLGIMAGTVISLPSCTDLSETVYDQVMSQNYYNTKQDVINAVFRPFEHIYESIVRLDKRVGRHVWRYRSMQSCVG